MEDIVLNQNEKEINRSEIKNKWSHIPFKMKDLPEIGLFFKKQYKGLGVYGSMGYFNWKIIENYLQPGIINLIKDNKKIASVTSITPKSLIYEGEAVKAAEIGDTYTDPTYQRQGMFALLINQTRKDAEKTGIKFIYGTPNQESLPGYEKKANFIKIQNIKIKSLILPIDYRYVIQKKSSWIISNLASPLFTILFYFFHKIKIFVFFNDKSFNYELVGELPQDWDEFWSRAKKGYSFILNRNFKATSWRYFSNPNKYSMIIIRKNKTLVGYIVYRIIADEASKSIMIADYLSLPGQEKSIFKGINHIVEYAFLTGASNLVIWCTEKSPFYNIFKFYGFLSRGRIPLICFKNEIFNKIVNCASFHFTMGDSDNV